MAPTIGRLALDNGFHGSIPGDWVAPPPQNIQTERKIYTMEQMKIHGRIEEKKREAAQQHSLQ